MFGLLKLPLMAGVLAILAAATQNDTRAMLGVVIGVTLVPLVILLKFVGRAMNRCTDIGVPTRNPQPATHNDGTAPRHSNG